MAAGFDLPGKLSNSWQNGFSRVTTRKGKGANSRVFTGDLMVGLGGLEPPTSPLSGARSSHLSYRPQHRSGTDHNHRSEEHTSELQSQSNLVCRLLLEK